MYTNLYFYYAYYNSVYDITEKNNKFNIADEKTELKKCKNITCKKYKTLEHDETLEYRRIPPHAPLACPSTYFCTPPFSVMKKM